MNRDASAVFDGERFLVDVRAYTDRHSISLRSLAARAGVNLSTLLGLMRGERPVPSLLVACSLAEVCDLSLDTYRRPTG